MTHSRTQNSARPWGGVKRPPVGRVGRCSCKRHEPVFETKNALNLRRFSL